MLSVDSVYLNHPRLHLPEIVRSTAPYTLLGPWVPIVQLQRRPEITLAHDSISRAGAIMSAENKRHANSINREDHIARLHDGSAEADAVVRAEQVGGTTSHKEALISQSIAFLGQSLRERL